MTNLNKFFKLFSLAALATLGVTVTSCDKDDASFDGSMLNVANQQTESISFQEGDLLSAPKGLNNLTGKTASEFTHVYADTQTLIITDSDGVNVWEGTYEPGNIAGLTGSGDSETPIVLPYGSYDANTTSSGDQTGAVLGFLPYTSATSFTVPPGGDINLAVTHSRGFAIVDVENTGDSRVQDARAGGADLIGPDAEGDYWGYILPEVNKEFAADYLLDGESTTISGTLTIEAGLAYTIRLALQDDAPDAADTYTVGEWEGTAPEAVISASGAPVVTIGTASSTVASVTETTTQAQISTVASYTQTRSVELVVNGVADVPAPEAPASSRVVPEVVTDAADLVTTREIANPAYVATGGVNPIDGSNGLGGGGDGTIPNGGGSNPVANGDDTVDFSSAVWGPDFVDQIADFTQSRTGVLVQVDALGPNTPELTESRNIIVTGDSSTDWFFRLGTNGEATGGHADQSAAEAAGEALAGSNNLQIYIFSRISTVYSADNGIAATHTVRGDLVGVRNYANPGYTAPVADLPDTLSPFSAWTNIAGSEVSAVNGQPVRGSLIRTEYLIGSTVYTSLADAQASVAAGTSADIITREVYSTTIAVSAATVQQERTRTVVQQGNALDATPPAGDLREVRTIETAAATSIAGDNENVDSTDSYTAPSATVADEWTEDGGVYTNPTHAGVSFTNVQLAQVIAFVAPNGVATADLTLADGTTQAVQTANGDDTLADLIAFIETLL